MRTLTFPHIYLPHPTFEMKSSLKDFTTLFFFSLVIPSFAFTQIQKIYLSPKAAGNAKQSNFVDSIHFVPLEIREDIKFTVFTYVQVTEKYFLLMDYTDRYVLVYAKDGRFIQKINYKKLGEGFYPNYHKETNELIFFGNNRSYALTKKDLIKIRLDWSNPRNKKYFKKYRVNLNDTTFSVEKETPDENDVVQAYPLIENYYMQGRISTSPLYGEGKDFELKIYKDKKLVKSYFPYDRMNEPRFLYTEEKTSFNYTDTSYIQIITRPYCDTIYKMIRDSIIPAYHLVMPMENSLPPSFFTKPFKNKTDRENFSRNNGWVFQQVYNFYETPGLFYFNVRYQSNYESYIYKRKGNFTYKTNNIKADSSQYNLKLLADMNIARHDDKFYKLQKAGDLVTFFDQNKNVPVPKELEEFLRRKPHSTAPVIVEFKLKSIP